MENIFRSRTAYVFVCPRSLGVLNFHGACDADKERRRRGAGSAAGSSIFITLPGNKPRFDQQK